MTERQLLDQGKRINKQELKGEAKRVTQFRSVFSLISQAKPTEKQFTPIRICRCKNSSLLKRDRREMIPKLNLSDHGPGTQA